MNNNPKYGQHTAVQPSDSLASGMAIDQWAHDLEELSANELEVSLQDYADQLAVLNPIQLAESHRVRRITKVKSAIIRGLGYLGDSLNDLPDIYDF